eukprot:419617-Prymnesium_polylepis.2
MATVHNATVKRASQPPAAPTRAPSCKSEKEPPSSAPKVLSSAGTAPVMRRVTSGSEMAQHVSTSCATSKPPCTAVAPTPQRAPTRFTDESGSEIDSSLPARDCPPLPIVEVLDEHAAQDGHQHRHAKVVHAPLHSQRERNGEVAERQLLRRCDRPVEDVVRRTTEHRTGWVDWWQRGGAIEADRLAQLHQLFARLCVPQPASEVVTVILSRAVMSVITSTSNTVHLPRSASQRRRRGRATRHRRVLGRCRCTSTPHRSSSSATRRVTTGLRWRRSTTCASSSARTQAGSAGAAPLARP